MSIETKAGLFLLGGLILLGLVTFKVEDLGGMWREKYDVHATVQHAAGLEAGDTVAVAGMSVGEVAEMRLEDDGVHVVLSIDREHAISRDSVGVIAWSGLLGGRYVDISRGSSPERFQHGDTISMTEAFRPDALFQELGDALGGVQKFFDQDQLAGFRQMVPKVDSALTSINSLAEDLRSGEGTMGKLLASDELYAKLNKAADELAAAAAQVNQLVEARSQDVEKIIADLGEAVPTIKNAARSLESISAKAEKGEGPLTKLLTDENMSRDLEETLASLKSFSASLDEGQGILKRLATDTELAADLEGTVANLRQISERLARGEGTAGKLLADEKLYRELRSAVTDAREMLRDIKEQIPVGALGSAISAAF